MNLRLPSALVLALLLGCAQSAGTMTVVDLRVDYQAEPMTVARDAPRFSWRMESEAGDSRQRAYRVEVIAGTGDVAWDSGEVAGSRSQGVAYDGRSLEPGSRYDWRVTVWPGQGDPVTAASWFETGIGGADESGFSAARWIGGSERDLVFDAGYLSVFSLAFDLRLDRDSRSSRAAFLLGGNDFRLMQAHLNVHGVALEPDRSFFALEFDAAGLDDASGQAQVNVYRVGHTAEDSPDEPLARLPIPVSIVNDSNRYERHRIHVDVVFGVLSIYVDGHDDEHRITEFDPARAAFSAQGLAVSPLGSGGNYIAYPMLGDVGFWMKPGEQAEFSNIEVRHLRAPSNELFAAGVPDDRGYEEIFLGRSDVSGIREGENGAYLVAGEDDDTIVLADPGNGGVPMLRREFALADKTIARARLYATARGIYELYVNGERVGDSYFTPGLMQYDQHHPYQAYDVTALLAAGADNVVGAVLGEGWWSGNVTYTGSNWNYFGDRQALLARLVVTYDDGSTTVLVTEPAGWRVYHDGPLRYGSFFQGEVYDASREANVSGWASTGFDAGDWQPAEVVPLEGSAFLGDPAVDRNQHDQLVTGYDDMQFVGQIGESPTVVATLEAVSVEETRPGVFVYDMGQNMVGFPRISLGDVSTGEPVILRYSEVLYPELPAHAGLERTPMMENLRAALVHDIYYPGGDDSVIQPRFTFHGYRYLEVSGLAEALPLTAVEGLVVSSVTDFSANYETSNPTVNRLWENIKWSMRGNFLSIPTDTPARNERMGWSGDISVFARTANYLGQVNPFMTRHLLAMRDLQSDEGRFPDVAPVGGGFGGTLWGSAGVTVAWETYRQYGDRSLLSEHYPAMRRYVDFLDASRDPEYGLIQEGPLGDWLSPEGEKNDNTLLWEAYFVYLADVLRQSAEILGQDADAARFEALHGKQKAFFNDTYVDAETGRTVSSGFQQILFGPPPTIDPATRGELVDTQASYAIPIALGVFDADNLERAYEHLANTIERENVDDGGTQRPAYSLMTGFIGTAAIGDALSAAGRDDLAYRLLQQTSYPSWLYPVLNGATTIWERLDSYTVEAGFGGNNSMNSFNHYAFGAVGGWMMSRSLGIRPADGSAGYSEFVLAPSPDPTGQMTWAKGYYDSLHGRISSAWSIDGDATTFSFVVPDNTNATLKLPVPEGANVDGDTEALRGEEAAAIFALGPGQHEFTVTRTAAPSTR